MLDGREAAKKSKEEGEEKSIAFQMSFSSTPRRRRRPGGKFEPRGGILIPAWATELSEDGPFKSVDRP